MARNYAAECARLEASAPDRMRGFLTLLREQLPEKEEALVGYDGILDFLRRLRLRRPNGGSITRTMIRRWARDQGFPLLRGNWRPRTPPFTSTFLVTAWVISRPNTGQRHLFRVY
jgi:hypothetical protein